MKEVIESQREKLRRREEMIKDQSQKKVQIKTITEELLNKLNESYS